MEKNEELWREGSGKSFFLSVNIFIQLLISLEFTAEGTKTQWEHGDPFSEERYMK